MLIARAHSDAAYMVDKEQFVSTIVPPFFE
jgi:hypothetical protein